MGKYGKGAPPINEPDFFSWLEPFEHRECRDYLLSQEIVRQQRIFKRDPKSHQYTETVSDLTCPGQSQMIVRYRRPREWLATRVAMIRKAWGVGKTFVGTPVVGNPLWSNHPATRLLVSWSEWPGKPYWEIPVKERLRRIEAFSALPSEPDRLTACEYLLNSHRPSIHIRAIVKIAITDLPWPLQMEAFQALVKIYVPELFAGAKAPQAKPGGRKSEEARVLDDLNAFAAHQLCRVQKVPRARVIRLICYPKNHPAEGQQVYSDPHQLNKPLRRFPQLIRECCVELMGNLIPLTPGSFGVLPDFT